MDPKAFWEKIAASVKKSNEFRGEPRSQEFVRSLKLLEEQIKFERQLELAGIHRADADAEDGRWIENVSDFIRWVKDGKPKRDLST